MNNKNIKRSFIVTFDSHRLPNRHYAEAPISVEVGVHASSIKEALNIASKQALAEFVHHKPRWIANVCWVRDAWYEGCGYIGGQATRGPKKLSAPYSLTRRLIATVTLGNIPLQLELDFNQ